MRRRRLLILAIGVVALVAAAVVLLGPQWIGPALPAGATRLQLATESPDQARTLFCPAAFAGPIRVATSNNHLIVVSVATGEVVNIAWPRGWVAWRIDERAELVARDGTIVAREGDVLDLGKGLGVEDSVCVIGG